MFHFQETFNISAFIMVDIMNKFVIAFNNSAKMSRQLQFSFHN